MLEISERRFGIVDRLADEIELLFEILASAHSLSTGCARIWLSAVDIRREIASFCQDIEQFAREAGPHAIDPEDCLTDRMLASQSRIRSFIEWVRSQDAKTPTYFWMQRWMLRRAEKEMLTQHRLLDLARTTILEHDADCSPVLEGEFNSAESLLDAIRKDAA